MAVIRIKNENGAIVEIPAVTVSKDVEVPEVTGEDNGKVLQVVDGAWTAAEMEGLISEGNTKLSYGSSVAVGSENTVGVMAYYYKAIDHTNRKIYLSKTQVKPVATTEDLTDKTFETPAYTVGKKFSLVNGSHWDFVATIVSIQNNVVTYDVALPSRNMGGVSGPDDASFFVPEEPHIGIVQISAHCAAFGVSNKATNSGSFAAGKDNIVGGDNAAAFGRKNKVGYVSFAAGRENEVIPEKGSGFGFAAGYKNKVTAGYSSAFGAGNIMAGGNSLVSGSGNTVEGTEAFGYGEKVQVLNKGGFAGGLNTTAYGKYSVCLGYSDAIADVEEVSRVCTNYYRYKVTEDTERNKDKTYYIFVPADGTYAEEHADSFLEGVTYYEVETTVGTKLKGVSCARGYGSFVYGHNNIAASENATVFGCENLASGVYSFAEGVETMARGTGAHAAGHLTKADAPYSYAGGTGTYTRRINQYVVGEWNIPRNDALFIVGNGAYVYEAVDTSVEEFDTNKTYYVIDEKYGNYVVSKDTKFVEGTTYYEVTGATLSNAFEVWQDGSATVQTQGTAANSVVTIKYLNEVIAQLTAEIKELRALLNA